MDSEPSAGKEPAVDPPVDPHHLARFLGAQNPVLDEVLAELKRGRKTTHWIWFFFPQLKALGSSNTSKDFGLASRAEALAYWQHPVLKNRLRTCTSLMLGHAGKTALHILGSPDDAKLRSCMTLFAEVAPEEPLFGEALWAFFDGRADPATLRLLKEARDA